MSHKFLFTGLEVYTLHQEIQKWKSAFLQKYGEQGLFVFKSDDLDKATITNCIFSQGMFATKKLIIIYGVPRDNYQTNKALASKISPIEEMLIAKRDQIPTDSVVILVSYKPDKRTKGYKFFEKNAEVKVFKELKGVQLTQFVEKKLGSLVDNKHANLIVSLVGNNLFNLANECDKLALYAQYHQLDKLDASHIEQVVYAQAQIDSFKILDNLFTNKEKTLELISAYQEQSTDIFQFLGMLYRGLKMVIQMVDLHTQWITNSKEIASKLKIHPFAISKQNKNITTLRAHFSKIKSFYHDLLELDYNIKSWIYPAEGFWLEIKKMVWGL